MTKVPLAMPLVTTVRPGRHDEGALHFVMSPGIVPVAKSLNELLVSQDEQDVYAPHDRRLRFVESRLRACAP